MNVPDILGVEVITPDGRGSILSLHNRRVIVHVNTIQPNQVMKGDKRDEMHYSYKYEDVEIIKGRYCFDDTRINFQYEIVPSEFENSKIIKNECEKVYEQITLAQEKLKELRDICKHEHTTDRPYAWRVGSTDIAKVCDYCGKNCGFVTKEL